MKKENEKKMGPGPIFSIFLRYGDSVDL